MSYADELRENFARMLNELEVSGFLVEKIHWTDNLMDMPDGAYGYIMEPPPSISNVLAFGRSLVSRERYEKTHSFRIQPSSSTSKFSGWLQANSPLKRFVVIKSAGGISLSFAQAPTTRFDVVKGSLFTLAGSCFGALPGLSPWLLGKVSFGVEQGIAIALGIGCAMLVSRIQYLWRRYQWLDLPVQYVSIKDGWIGKLRLSHIAKVELKSEFEAASRWRRSDVRVWLAGQSGPETIFLDSDRDPPDNLWSAGLHMNAAVFVEQLVRDAVAKQSATAG